MNKKMKYIVYGGILAAIVATVFETLLLKNCTGNIVCFGIDLILISPGIAFVKMVNGGVMPWLNVFANLIFYFLIGGIIGLIVYKVKNKK